MSYLPLARKYRPQGFGDVIAQEHVTRTLRNALTQDRLGTAYLFCGVRGTGKTTCARILAKAVNCEKAPTDQPCGVCASCSEITSSQGMDVLEIDAASNTGVDDVRTLRENVRYLPTRGKKRVFIIDEVHRLSGAAFDALLKTLEEPPAHVLFIFATTEPLKVPDTILSRTQRFDFRRVSIDDLADHLISIATAEGLNLSADAARRIARRGDGSVRDALSLLDHVVAFTGKNISAEAVSEALGLVDTGLIMKFLAAVTAKETKQALQLVGTMFREGVDVDDFLKDGVEVVRLLLHAKIDGAPGEELAAQELSAEIMQRTTTGDLVRIAQIMQETAVSVKGGIDEQLAMDLLAVRLAELTSTVSLDSLLDLIPERMTPPSGPAATTTPPKVSEQKKITPALPGKTLSTSATVRQATTSAPASTSTSQSVKPVDDSSAEPWPRLLGAVRRQNPMLSAQLSIAEPIWPAMSTLKLRFSPEQQSAYQWLQRSDQAALLSRTMRELFGQSASWSSELAETLPPNPEDVTPQAARSPEVQRLLSKVDGEIVSVRRVSK